MKRIFADTSFFVAFLNKRDPLHKSALAALDSLRKPEIHTSEEVLTEFLAFNSRNPYLRQQTLESVKQMIESPSVTVHPQSSERFMQALELYGSRLDKGYSLVDCSSMILMKTLKIAEVLSNDHHFSQEGFTELF